MPGECKSILNVKILHKSYIAKPFGPRVFCFFGGSKKNFGRPILAGFAPTLKIILKLNRFKFVR